MQTTELLGDPWEEGLENVLFGLVILGCLMAAYLCILIPEDCVLEYQSKSRSVKNAGGYTLYVYISTLLNVWWRERHSTQGLQGGAGESSFQ